MAQKILILCLPALGDTLMATPMIKLLKSKMPDSIIDAATMFGGSSYVLKNNPNINKVYQLSLYGNNKIVGLKQIFNLRKQKYDLSILAFPAYRKEYHIVHFLCGAKKRIAHKFKRGYWSELNFLNTDLIDVDENEHNIINNLNHLNRLGIKWQEELKREEIKYDLKLDQEDIVNGDKYINDLGWNSQEIVGIHPGSTDSPAAILRRWPLERYSGVAKFLIKEKRKKVLIFVGPDEKSLGKRLYDLISDSENSHLLEDIEFNKAVGILNKIDLLLCNDNGFAHLAVALDKKILTLWASTNDKWSLPWDGGRVSLLRPAGFYPWYRYDLKRNIPYGEKGGMELINEDLVIDTLNTLIEK